MAIHKNAAGRNKAKAPNKTANNKSPTRKKKIREMTANNPNTATRHNRAAHWKAYRELQAKADKAWETFRADVKKNARSDVLIRDHNHLRLLLGECNYMARECMRIATKGKMKAPVRESRKPNKRPNR